MSLTRRSAIMGKPPALPPYILRRKARPERGFLASCQTAGTLEVKSPPRLANGRDSTLGAHSCNYVPWHFLYFLPDPQGHGSLRPTFSAPRTTCCTVLASPLPAMRACSSSRRFFLWKASSRSSIEVATWRGGRPLPPPGHNAGAPASGPPCPTGPPGPPPSPTPPSVGRSRICIR